MTTEVNAETSKFQNAEIAPMHTAEHLLNQTMTRLFGCERSHNAHIERKKSKVSYRLSRCPSEKEVADICDKMNALIAADLPVRIEFCSPKSLPEGVSTDKLPDGAMEAESVRLVRIGDYDVCACIGLHVSHTSQLGRFVLLGTNWDAENGSFRIRFKLEGASFAD